MKMNTKMASSLIKKNQLSNNLNFAINSNMNQTRNDFLNQKSMETVVENEQELRNQQSQCDTNGPRSDISKDLDKTSYMAESRGQNKRRNRDLQL